MVSGGIPSVTSDGKLGQDIYFMGIIDILIEYGKKKSVENFAKTRFSKDSSGISCQPPDVYAKRFREFMINDVLQTHPDPPE